MTSIPNVSCGSPSEAREAASSVVSVPVAEVEVAVRLGRPIAPVAALGPALGPALGEDRAGQGGQGG